LHEKNNNTIDQLYWKRDKFIHFVVHYYFGLKSWITLFYFIHDLQSVAINIVQFYPFRSIVYREVQYQIIG